MQEMANVTQVAGRTSVPGFTAAARQTEGMSGIFDEVLNAMMASARADSAPPADSRTDNVARASYGDDFAPRAGGTGETSFRREARDVASHQKADADDSRPVVGAEGAFGARSQAVSKQDDSQEKTSGVSERDDAPVADEAASQEKPAESDDAEDDDKDAKPQNSAAAILKAAVPDAAFAAVTADAQAGSTGASAESAPDTTNASATDAAPQNTVGFVQGNGAAQPQKAGQAVAAKPAGEEQAAAVAQGFQPAKAAGNGSVAGQAAQQVAGQKTAEQLQPSQPVVEQAAPDAQNKPEAAKPQLSTTDAPQQAVKPAPQAKPEGADNTAKPWDVQSQDAQPKAGANVAQGTQPAAYAQSVSTDDASKQSAQASPKPVEPTAFSDASQLPLAQASTGSGGDADAKGGTFFDGKGSEGADAGRLSSSKSDAPAQNADLQKGEFAQKLNATRGTARVDQAETIDKIVKSMTMAVKRGESEVRIMLQPARLGNVRIEMQVKDGVLNASFETQTQAARHAISNGLPQLKAALESQGIEVGGFNVSVEQESGQSKFTDERGTFGNFSDGSALLAGNEDEEDYDIFAEKQRMSAGTSLVDYFV